MLSALKSFRPGKILDVVKNDTEGCQIEAHTSYSDLSTSHLKYRIAGKSRQLSVDNQSSKPSDFVRKLRVVLFSPESLDAIKSGPDSRRQLVDQALAQVSPSANIAQGQFTRALRQRNACLKAIKQGRLSQHQGRMTLESLDPSYLQLSTDIIGERLCFLDNIREDTQNTLEAILGQKVTLDFSYRSQDSQWKERSPEDIKERLTQELNDPQRRLGEEALGTTLTGPHRHDLGFVFSGNDSRIFCSQGQQRALILSFKMAEIVYHHKVFGSYPIFLLDDVLSEFDAQKRRYLVEFLGMSQAQTFLTTTDQIEVSEGYSDFHIRNGSLLI